jgi:hypothetical protein
LLDQHDFPIIRNSNNICPRTQLKDGGIQQIPVGQFTPTS